MMPTPGLRLSSSDGPRSSPDIGSSRGSQSMPIPDSPDEDLNEDALPDGLLPDLPPGWIMSTARGLWLSRIQLMRSKSKFSFIAKPLRDF
ncbi:hypothetical protein RIF29_28801 [Crotalaria pallida]|uniref:Uncharacterized protein n=1 Tax=Crotalaria pallida TaxID=3830 RepID=A0AAN9EDB6_CROPI